MDQCPKSHRWNNNHAGRGGGRPQPKSDALHQSQGAYPYRFYARPPGCHPAAANGSAPWSGGSPRVAPSPATWGNVWDNEDRPPPPAPPPPPPPPQHQQRHNWPSSKNHHSTWATAATKGSHRQPPNNAGWTTQSPEQNNSSVSTDASPPLIDQAQPCSSSHVVACLSVCAVEEESDWLAASSDHKHNSKQQNGHHAAATATTADNDPWMSAMKQMDEQNKLQKKIGLIVQQRYEIVSKLSFGSYGSIYVANDLQSTSDRQVALKFEAIQNGGTQRGHLKYESTVYEVLDDLMGIPKVYGYSIEYEHNILVMDLLGPSLEQLFTFCQRKFSIKTVCLIGKQMVARLKDVHARGFVHRDIKPENFLIGLNGNETLIYLIDYGLARRYRFRDKQTRDLRHIPFKNNKSMVGTARYASINSHQGRELSRRDDLESVAYVLLGFLLGELPWKESFNKQRYRTKKQIYGRIKDMKIEMKVDVLCKHLPPQFAIFLHYCRNMAFADAPDYDYLIGLLDRVLVDHRYGAAVTNAQPQDYDWVDLRTDPEKRFSYECGFKWTLPPGTEPVPPRFNSGFLGFGGDSSTSSVVSLTRPPPLHHVPPSRPLHPHS